jgi:hypothetical protein
MSAKMARTPGTLAATRAWWFAALFVLVFPAWGQTIEGRIVGEPDGYTITLLLHRWPTAAQIALSTNSSFVPGTVNRHSLGLVSVVIGLPVNRSPLYAVN